MLDIVFGKGVTLDESLTVFVGDDLTIVVDDVLSEDTADESLVKAELLSVFETASATKVISLWIEEFLH